MYTWPYATLPSVGQTYANTSQFYQVSVLGSSGAWAQGWPKFTNTGPQNVALHGSGSIFTAPFGGTSYAASTPFTSTGGGANCVVAGNLIAPSGVPQYAVYTTNTGCTSLPTIVMGAAPDRECRFTNP